MQNKQKAWRLGAAILKTLPQFKALPDHKKPSARTLKTMATFLGAAWRRGEGSSSALYGDKPAKLVAQPKRVIWDIESESAMKAIQSLRPGYIINIQSESLVA